LTEREVKFTEIKDYLLSPGNLFWVKRSGVKRLITKKGDPCNFEFLEKISKRNEAIVLSEEVDRQILFEANELYSEYKKILIYKDKIELKHKIINFINRNLLSEDASQFEINLICCKWFCAIPFEELKLYLKIDNAYFTRAASIACTHTLILFICDYYEADFLSKTFRDVFYSYYNIINDKPFLTSRNKLEEARNGKIDLDFFISAKNKEKILILENEMGGGLNGYVENELSDYEKNLICMNREFSYENTIESNLLKLVVENKIQCNRSTRLLMLKMLGFESKEMVA
jgi:hypothetical protein